MQQHNNATSQHCNNATIQHCNDARSQQRNTATIQHCNYTTLQVKTKWKKFYLYSQHVWGTNFEHLVIDIVVLASGYKGESSLRRKQLKEKEAHPTMGKQLQKSSNWRKNITHMQGCGSCTTEVQQPQGNCSQKIYSTVTRWWPICHKEMRKQSNPCKSKSCYA